MTLLVKIDDREHQLAEYMRKEGIEFELEHLTLGDIHIIDSETQRPVWIFERKTLPDFSASITDGRYHEQRARLLQFITENPSSRVGYIIETDNTRRIDEKMYNIITSASVSCHLLHISMFYSIRGIRDTCYFIDRVLKKQGSCVSSPTFTIPVKNSNSKEDFLRNILLSIKTFGPKTYTKLQDANFTSLSLLREVSMDGSHERHADLKKCLGKARLAKLVDYLNEVW